MRKNLFKIFAVVMVLAMVLPVAAFGQGGNGIAQTPVRPDGFTPEGLVPVGEGPAGSVVDLSPDENGMSNYIVTFSDPAIASYTGGIEGIPATSPAVTGETKLNTRAPSVESYRTYLETQQLTAISQAEQLIGRNVDVKYQFQHALNAAVFKMTAAEAASVAQMDGVLRVEKDVAYPVNTDVSPDWIGVSELWEGSGTGLPVTKGEGIIVGLVDTGINMDHPSFAETDDFGYTHTNPYGEDYFLGWCNQDNPNFKGHYDCNNKLIGAWDYADASWAGTADEENDGPEDSDGHGSHTASTAAGNTILAASLVAPTTAITDTISGMAPHANIIAYDVCAESCYTSDSVAAVNQAILDGVDVINESISLGGDSFEGAKQQAYLGATLTGIFVARSAGNEGPGAATVGPEPPWTLSTAALTHNRTMFNYLTDMTGGENPPADIQGVGFTAGYGPAE
ncbi:MAG: S8 family serine peptidase, partial [Gammaproteobacteria bacterium]|nr:S8 family serine peptidase [Gammaproteobacteria bacterium]